MAFHKIIAEDTLNFIKEKQIIVLKPICGGKGKSIQIIEYQNLGGWSLNGKISCNRWEFLVI